MDEPLRPVRRIRVEEQAVAGLHSEELVRAPVHHFALQHVEEFKPFVLKGRGPSAAGQG